MHSLKTVLLLSVMPLALLSGCASPPTLCPQPPAVPAEMMTPGPPSLYFQTKLEAILSSLPEKPTQQPTDSERIKP